MSELRKFEELSAPKKVKAILAVVYEAVTKEFAIHLSGVDLNELSGAEQTEVEAIFTGDEVEVVTLEADEQRYRLKPEVSAVLFEVVSRQSVSSQVSNTIWRDLFPET